MSSSSSAVPMAVKQSSTRTQVSDDSVELYTHRWHSPDPDAARRPTVVLLHYWGGSHQTWNDVATHLANAGLDCVAYDARGWGQSTRTCPSYSLEAMADDLGQLLLRWSSGNPRQTFVLVGHSMGGRTAMLHLARGSATRVCALVLLATSPPIPQPMPEEQRTSLASLYSALGSDDVIVNGIIAQISRTPLGQPAIGQIVNDTRACSEAAWRAWPERNMLLDLQADMISSQALANIPVVLINAPDDPVEPSDSIEALVIPTLRKAGATTIEVQTLSPGIGHLLPYEAPDEVAQNIHRILKSKIVPSPLDVKERSGWLGK